MRIGFIGAGKVGFSLGKYFAVHNVDVTGYYSRNLDSSKEAAKFTNTKCYEKLEDIICDSDILFLTVSDGSISEVYSKVIQYDIAGKCLVHCSGALSSNVFLGISDHKARAYSIHPICAVSSKLTGYQELSKAYFTIEGKDTDELAELIRSLGNSVEVIDADKKIKYHVAAVFASNLVIGVYNIATKLLKDCGLSEEFSEHALQSLFIKNAENIVSKGVVESLTGPVERVDCETIKKHFSALDGEEKKIYRILSNVVSEVAKKKNPNKSYEDLDILLKKGNES